jgi:SAM-dependent methyltransferase
VSVADFYRQHPYPCARYFSPLRHQASAAPTLFEGDVLVVGCGTIEANLVAQHNPRARVVGIDVSDPSLRVSRAVRRKYRQRNLTLLASDVRVFEPRQFDWVVASGVLHHVEDDRGMVTAIRERLKLDGVVAGMVYSDRRPPIIRELNARFRAEGFTVADVRRYLERWPNEWYETHVANDEELADTWLNPFFREYSEEQLADLLSPIGVPAMDLDGPFDNKLSFVCRRTR